QPSFETLAGRRNEGYGTGLGSHHRHANREPPRFALPFELGVERLLMARFPHAVNGDSQDRAHQHHIIDGVHENALASANSSTTQSAKLPSTKVYTAGQVESQGKSVESSSLIGFGSREESDIVFACETKNLFLAQRHQVR